MFTCTGIITTKGPSDHISGKVDLENIESWHYETLHFSSAANTFLWLCILILTATPLLLGYISRLRKQEFPRLIALTALLLFSTL